MIERIKNIFLFLKECYYKYFRYTTNGNVLIESPSFPVNIDDKKIAVYTCIVGNYDPLIEPLIVEQRVDYYVFTDQEVPDGSKWKKIDITRMEDYQMLSPSQLNRKIKMLPHQFLPGYDYSIYIDGNIEIQEMVTPLVKEMGDCGFGVHYHRTRDCIYHELVRVLYLKKANKQLAKSQVAAYRKEGFPRHFGLYENTVLIRNHHDESSNRLMEAWWQEYMKYPTRDQLSLPYVIWKTGYNRKNIHIIGMNIDNNNRIKRIISHI
jgi:hypothetical protein